METITNAATAASRAIWGDTSATPQVDSGKEPIAGQTGDTSKGEPYDAGNIGSKYLQSQLFLLMEIVADSQFTENILKTFSFQ